MKAASATAGMILAGGRSRRMGKNKALLPVPGNAAQTFVAYLADLLGQYCPEILLVVQDQASGAVYEQPGLLPYTHLVYDEQKDQGPLMGLYSGLKALRAERVLVVGVDMPFIQPSLVEWLLALPLSDSLVVPWVQGVPQVLLALYPRSILPIVETCIEQGRRDLRALLELAPVTYLAEAQLRMVDPQLRSFVNINTPEELQKT